MERVSFEIERQDVADALHAQANAHGRTIEAELAALVEQTYGHETQFAKPGDGGNWVQELIDIAKQIDLEQGIDPYLAPRSSEGYEPVRL